MGVPSELSLPTGDIACNRNPQGLDKHLTMDARIALENWYKEDYEFIDMCDREMTKRL
jgi:hypothetical protein